MAGGGFVDIVPETEVVHGVTLHGIPFREVVKLFRRFPELSALFGGVPVSDIGGDTMAAVILAGSGYAGDAEQEAAIGNLPMHMQLDFIEPLVRLTVGKNGIGPFIQKLATSLGGSQQAVVGPETTKKIPSRKFHRPPNGSSMSAGEPSEKSLT